MIGTAMSVVLTLAVGAAGGIAGWALGMPLGFLLGSLIAVGVIAGAGWQIAGRGMVLPMRLRMSFVPVIGVSIGGAFTPAVVEQALGWGPSLAALAVFLPLAHGAGYAVYRRAGLPRAEAYFGAVPGGLIESIALGEEAGADLRILTLLQFLRLILTIMAVPVIFVVVTGHAVGSAAGVQMVGADVQLGLRDVLGLIAVGGVGVVAGRVLRLPGWIITGPIAASALAHGFGWVQGVPPGWLIALTQVVLGTGLGARFAGIDRAVLPRVAAMAVVNAVLALGLAFGFALGLHALVGEPVAAVFLAFAPGGLAEMSLIALSLNMSVAYVTVHHVARIALAVGFARLGGRFLR